ncbi:oligosaccharide repeat unit polymerase [Candidatus Kaiserbacteria bacterium]|nr:oligosaccharide repeat unit polymerase [Candidatus Kaiserbacteria bacterium]
MKKGFPLFFSAISFIIAGVVLLTITGIPLSIRLPEKNLALLLIAVAAIPAISGILRGSFDVFEPIHYLSLSFAIYYGLMVIILMQTDSFYMLGQNYEHMVGKMLLLALIALISAYAGYYSWRSTTRVSRLTNYNSRSFLSASERAFLHQVTIWIFLFFATLVVLWIIVARIPTRSLFVFGGSGYGSWRADAQGPAIGYLYLARNSLAACIIMMLATRPNVSDIPWKYILLTAAIAVFLAGTGGRTRVMYVVLGVWSFLYLERQRRPSITQTLLFSSFIFYVLIGAIGFFRRQGRVIGQTEYGLGQAWSTFEESTGIAVSTAAKLYWIPDYTGWLGGQSFIKVFIQWIPSSLWAQKHQFYNNSTLQMIQDYFPDGSATAYWTTWYINFGILGIAVGMVLLAIIFKEVYYRYHREPDNLFLQANLALAGAFLISMSGRGDPTAWTYNAIAVFAPIWISRFFLQRYRQSQNISQHQLYSTQDRRSDITGKHRIPGYSASDVAHKSI